MRLQEKGSGRKIIIQIKGIFMYKHRFGVGDLFVGLSVVAVIFAGVGYFGYNIELASTQWMLIATVLALWGIYLKPNSR